MLKKTWVKKDIVIHSDEWFQGRLAKVTASEWHNCMGDKFDTVGCINYIYRKVGEDISGLPCRDEISNDATEHGHIYEAENLKQLVRIKNLPFIITQRLIVPDDEGRFGCTPDALIYHKESTDGLFDDVSTVEAKCPKSYDGYIKLALCNSPSDIYGVSKIYFWQVLFQMSLCDCLRGYLCAFQPFFKFGNTRIIEFRKLDLVPQFKLINERKKMVEDKFNEVRHKLLNIKN